MTTVVVDDIKTKTSKKTTWSKQWHRWLKQHRTTIIACMCIHACISLSLSLNTLSCLGRTTTATTAKNRASQERETTTTSTAMKKKLNVSKTVLNWTSWLRFFWMKWNEMTKYVKCRFEKKAFISLLLDVCWCVFTSLLFTLCCLNIVFVQYRLMILSLLLLLREIWPKTKIKHRNRERDRVENPVRMASF